MLKMTEDQAAMLAEMPEHSRRVIESRLLSGLGVAVETGNGVALSAGKLCGLQVETSVFLRVVDQVFILPDLNEDKRENLYQAWLKLGKCSDGAAIWRLAQLVNCKVSKVSAVLERWEQSASIDSRWQQMNVAFCHGANCVLLKQFYGCSQAEFGKLRAENHCQGLRKKRLQEAEDVAFYQLWKSRGCRNDIEGLLSLSGDTGYALSLIWSLIQDWLETEQHFSACQTGGRRQA